jgi:hypothetical protein
MFQGDLPTGAGTTVREFLSCISSDTNTITVGFVNQFGLACFTASISASMVSKGLDINNNEY